MIYFFKFKTRKFSFLQQVISWLILQTKLILSDFYLVINLLSIKMPSTYIILCLSECILTAIQYEPFLLLIETIVPSANSLNPDEMPSNSASHQDPSCFFTLRLHFFSPILSDFGGNLKSVVL